MSFHPSSYQQAVFDEIQNSNRNLEVEAVAGSGKTTTLVQALNYIDPEKTVLFLAFNKRIAEELSNRIPENVDALTLNSYGFRTLKKILPYHMKLSAWKSRTVLDEFLKTYDPEIGKSVQKDLADSIVRLVALAKAEGIAPQKAGLMGIMEDTPDAWEKIIDHHDLDFYSAELTNLERDPEWEGIQIAREVLRMSVENRELIDFDDQIYLTVLLGLNPPSYDYIFVDEAQDLSSIQRALIKRSVGDTGRVIFVGDSRQSIYGFRGADSQSISKIIEEFNCKTLPLSISYRCPKTVVELAKQFVPEIESFEGAEEGKITHCETWNEKLLQPKDYVICRYNAPLVKIAYQLIASKIPVVILGRNIAATLIAIIKKLNAFDLETLSARVETWREQECKKLLSKNPEASLDAIDDKADAIQAFIEMSGAKTIDQLIYEIKKLFSDKDGLITLATVHKVKGLEANRVLILETKRRPRVNQKQWQLEAERNIQYVAITRARKELYFLNYAGFGA